MASGVAAPAPGSGSDPTSAGSTGGGARLTAYNAAGGIDKVVLALPPGRWTRVGSAADPQYRYSDKQHADGPVTAVSVRNGKVTLRGRGAGLFSLVNAPQGTMALRLKLGTGIEL